MISVFFTVANTAAVHMRGCKIYLENSLNATIS